MAESINPYVSKIFDMANSLVPSFTSRLSTETAKTTPDRAMQRRLNEQLSDSQLNGSGPADLSLARESAPKSLRDEILGYDGNPGINPGGMYTAKNATAMSMFDTTGMLLIGVIIVGVIMMGKYKAG